MDYTNSNIIEQKLNEEKSKIDCIIKEYFREKIFSSPLSDEQKKLADAMEYSVMNGGKRFRPAIILDVCKCLGGDESLAVGPALAVEFIHCFSLIHDDLPCMDNDDMRRGLPSCHKKFDEATALLAGCSLISIAFKIILNSKISDKNRIKIMDIISYASGLDGLCGGQIMDIFAKKDEDNLVKIAKLKTGALFNASIQIGIICAEESGCSINHEKVSNLSSIGTDFSIMYQLVDDILDVISPTDELGKPNGSDSKLGKYTFVDIYGLEEAKKRANSQITELINYCDKNSLYYILYICKYIQMKLSKFEV